MICTVTLNPALDRIMILDEINYGENTRIKQQEIDVGGKGTHVAAVLSDLGIETVATGIMGSIGGEKLCELLEKRRVKCDFIWVESLEVRTSYIIVLLKDKKHFMITERGSEVNRKDIALLYEKIDKLSKSTDYMVFSGGVGPGFDKNVYRELIAISKSNGAKTVLDASGEYLREGAKSTPNFLKINCKEFSELVGHEMTDETDIVKNAKNLIEGGVEVVAITLGKDGSIVLTENEVIKIFLPHIEVVNTVGCGDIYLAGALYKMKMGKSTEECFTFAAALSASKALLYRTSEFDPATVKRLEKSVNISYYH
ncbi:1-phosphofructokinase family hexose kinase [Thermoanaerobacterium sp. DL9XJH110]|uniref:1-phosphofructokinase family hexose kinase n=1 Tax=Thermoanaerobacterium sp. DL9XJH110 TaxID=3386643 RepID=UPI003BB77E2E